MADEKRTPMEYLQKLFSKPWGPPPASTFEESATLTFPPGGVVGAGTPTIKPDISSLTGIEDTGQPERNAPPSFPVVPPSTPGPTPSGAGLLPPAPALTPDQAYRASITKEMRDLGATGLLPPNWFAEHPEFPGGGVLKAGDITESPSDMRRFLENAGVGTSTVKDADLKSVFQAYSQSHKGFDISNKLYTLLEPNRKTKIEQTMFDVINQVGDVLKKGLAGPSGTSVAENIFAHAPAWKTAGVAEQKLPAEIKHLESQAAAQTATALEGPARTKLLEAQARYYNVRPAEHGANTGALITNILVHDMIEAAKIDIDPLLDPDKKKIAHTAREDRTRKAIAAITAIMSPSSNISGTPMTASQFMSKASASGFTYDQIRQELDALIKQGKVISG